MEPVLRNGIVYIELTNEETYLSQEELRKEWTKQRETGLFIDLLFSLFGNNDWKIEKSDMLLSRFDSFYLNAIPLIRDIYTCKEHKQNLIKELNHFFVEKIKEGKVKDQGSEQDMDILFRRQAEVFTELQTFLFYLHQSSQAEEQLAILLSYECFKELIDKFGNQEELKSQYLSGLSFAPNRKLYIQKRISSLESANQKLTYGQEIWYPKPENRFVVQLGDYRRLGFEWVNNGHNVDRSFLSNFLVNNVTLNSIVPVERRNDIYVALLHQLAQGGALAFHIAFLNEELANVVHPIPNLQDRFISTVQHIHFEDLGGGGFERLVFAYVNGLKQWDKINWLGQTGNDGGIDIWGEINGESTCYQCANYAKLALKKIADDIKKLVKGNTIPNNYIVVAGGTVSNSLRSKIKGEALKFGILNVEIWSGVEFEERLRRDDPALFERFFNGRAFPI